jgi:cell division septal protein FtsQ
MPPRRRKKLKVAVRRSRVAYQWRSFADTVGVWVKGAFFVGSAVGVAWGAVWVWDKTSFLPISEVRVEGPVLPGWVEDPPVKKGQPLFSFSVGRVERRLLERYPQLESVRVRREWDRAVSLRLAFRRPVARVQSGGSWSGVDNTGAFFPLEREAPGLPILVLPDPEASPESALTFLAALRAAKEPWTDGLHKITMSPDGEAVLFLSGDVPVFWGGVLSDPLLVAQKSRRLQRVLSAPESVGGIEYARFVEDRRVVIKPRVAVGQRKEIHG